MRIPLRHTPTPAGWEAIRRMCATVDRAGDLRQPGKGVTHEDSDNRESDHARRGTGVVPECCGSGVQALVGRPVSSGELGIDPGDTSDRPCVMAPEDDCSATLPCRECPAVKS